jgi:hypothetical protein
MTREQEKLIHKVKVFKASATQLAKDATFLEEELGRLYGRAPKKSSMLTDEMESKILNRLRSKTINKKVHG